MRRFGAAVLAVLVAGFFTATLAAAEPHGPVAELGVDAYGRTVTLLPTDRTTRPVVVRLAADGSLDRSFSGDGLLRPPVQGKKARLVIRPRGYLIVAGRRDNDTIVRRYLPDGSPDRRFGGRGALRLRGVSLDRLLLQPRGKLIVLGVRTCSPRQCGYLYRNQEIFRINERGRVLRTVAVSHESWVLNEAAAGPRGEFIVSGFVWDVGYSTLERFRPSGRFERRLDLRFNPSFYEDSGPESEPGVYVLAFHPDGSFATLSAEGVWAWRRGGAPEVAFGGGFASCGPTEYRQMQPSFTDLAVAPGGALVAIGGGGECSLVRYRGDGLPDPGFGSDGTVDVTAAGMPRPQRLATLPDGSILLAGWEPGLGGLRVARYTAGGTLDPGFGEAGIATVPFAAPD